MEFFLELLFTVALSILFSFFIVKLVSMASEPVVRSGKAVVMEERNFEGELRNQGLPSEKRVEFVGEVVKVDELEGDLFQEKLEVVNNGEEFLKEGSELMGIRKDDRIGVEEKGLGEEIEVFELDEKSVEEVSDTEEMKAVEPGEERVSVGVGVLEDNCIEEMPERTEVREIDIELVKDEEVLAKNEQIRVVGYEGNQGIEIERAKKNGEDEENEGLLNDDDGDWEGIERSEMEKLFNAAATFVGSGRNNDRLLMLGNDLQMKLYGLYKVATEGHCHEPKPMALKMAAREKWNAWQQLGNMNPEEAMEQYIALLSDSIPGWMGEIPRLEGDSKQDSLEAGLYGMQAPDLSTFLQHQSGSANERKLEELQSCVEGGDAGGPNPLNKEKQ